jgi:hypothetical protein
MSCETEAHLRNACSMERSSSLRRIFPSVSKSGPSVDRTEASTQECGTGWSKTLRRLFPTQPRFAGERLGDGSSRFPGDPRRFPESCTFARRSFRGLVPTQPRYCWNGSCQRIVGFCTSGSRSCRGSDPIQPKLQKGGNGDQMHANTETTGGGKGSYFGLGQGAGKEPEWRRELGCWWRS